MAEETFASLGEKLADAAEHVAARRGRSFKPTDEDALDLDDLVGSWHNCDADTRSIVRIELKEKKGQLGIRVFGSCHPTPCDWGVEKATAYAESVADNDAIAFSVIYDHGFAEKIVTGHLDGGTLIVEVYTRFKDGSGRSNYYLREYLCKRGR